MTDSMGRRSIIPETWATAEMLSKKTGIPTERHYEALVDMFRRPTWWQRLVLPFDRRWWPSLLLEVLLVGALIAGVAVVIFNLG